MINVFIKKKAYVNTVYINPCPHILTNNQTTAYTMQHFGGNWSNQHWTQMFKQQKKLARVILDQPYDYPSESFSKEVNCKAGADYQKCILIYKCRKGLAPPIIFTKLCSSCIIWLSFKICCKYCFKL